MRDGRAPGSDEIEDLRPTAVARRRYHVISKLAGRRAAVARHDGDHRAGQQLDVVRAVTDREHAGSVEPVVLAADLDAHPLRQPERCDREGVPPN